jgi:hypothetical protein
MLPSCKLPQELHRDHTRIRESFVISIIFNMETDFFVTSGLSPPYWKSGPPEQKTRTSLFSLFIFRIVMKLRLTIFYGFGATTKIMTWEQLGYFTPSDMRGLNVMVTKWKGRIGNG